MEHRKLFPTSSATNQTDCPDFCDPSCPYGCYPYPDYFTPPPLPLPPPPPPPPSTGHAPPYVIIVVSLLASFFLLVSFYVIIVKYCSRWNLFRPPPTQSDGQDEEFVDENQGPPIDHPIWYIATVGLQPSIINSITVFRYKKGDHLIELTECSVCLSEFQEDETLRLLPKCNHAFHIPCIDTWLRSHTNCPLCRASIVIVSNTESPNEETEDETEDEVELPEADDERKESENSKEVLNSNGHEEFRAIVDLDDNSMILEDEIQPVRRSVSMDSSAAAANIGLAVSSFSMVESEGSLVNQKEDLGIENSSLNRLILGSSSIEQSLHKSPISLKRSFSYSGRLFLSRHSRSSSSILPL